MNQESSTFQPQQAPQNGLSVIIPALNEQDNIKAAVEEAIYAVSGRIKEYEILLFNDGSSDRTGEIMNDLSRNKPNVNVFHNKTPRNLGGVYKQGISLAGYDHLMMIPGDNENPASAVIPVIEALGKADIIIPYTTNTKTRTLFRRIGSRTYTILLNILFKKNLKYYNGTILVRTEDVRKISLKTNSFGYTAELLLKLLLAGKSYHEVGIEIQPPPGASSALGLRNLLGVFRTIRDLYSEIRTSTQHG